VKVASTSRLTYHVTMSLQPRPDFCPLRIFAKLKDLIAPRTNMLATQDTSGCMLIMQARVFNAPLILAPTFPLHMQRSLAKTPNVMFQHPWHPARPVLGLHLSP
jgi:hypothetical protein